MRFDYKALTPDPSPEGEGRGKGEEVFKSKYLV